MYYCFAGLNCEDIKSYNLTINNIHLYLKVTTFYTETVVRGVINDVTAYQGAVRMYIGYRTRRFFTSHP